MSITLDGVIRFVHLLSAAIWVGAMVSMTAVLPSMMSSGFHGSEVRGVARRFSAVSFPAMVVAIGTGVWKLTLDDVEITTPLWVKIGLAAGAILLALWHSRTAGLRSTQPGVLSFIRGLLLLTGIALIATSVWI